MKPFRMGISIPIVLVAAVAVAACGGDDEVDGDGTATTAAAGPDVISVVAADFSFDPIELEATKGDPITVEVTNAGSAPHTLTVYKDEEYAEAVEGADTGNISGGGTGEFTATFDEAGNYFFRCDIHPTQMEGELIVQ
jgi:plastocyanin